MEKTKDYKFTIFTPTYNRAHLIEKLYDALKKQTYKNFEWLIIDDGSTDNTAELINEFKKENILNISYIKKENSGKQKTYNIAIDNARGELFICLDSDDMYVANGLELILEYWNKNSDDTIAGMGYLSTYPNGDIIGSAFPEDIFISNQYEIYNKYKVTGDKGLMFRTKLLKNYKFPEIPNEKFITEAVVYNRISQKYKMLYINEKIEIKQYHEDGLTKKYEKLLLKNPIGNVIYTNEKNMFEMSFYDRVINNAVYYKFSKIAGFKFKDIYKDSLSKGTLILSILLGEYMYKKARRILNEEK